MQHGKYQAPGKQSVLYEHIGVSYPDRGPEELIHEQNVEKARQGEYCKAGRRKPGEHLTLK